MAAAVGELFYSLIGTAPSISEIEALNVLKCYIPLFLFGDGAKFYCVITSLF